MKVKIINNSNNELPKHMTEGSAGVDLRAEFSDTIPARSFLKIHTGIGIEIPEGYEVQIRPRSGLMSKGIVAGFGTIDSDYRGEISVILFNYTDQEFRVLKGDRIAQAVLAKHEYFDFEEVSELSETERGTKGFGSTGI